MREVMDCFDFNQLQPGESQDQCGFAATALCFAAGQPGHGPRQPVQWAIEKMAAWYTEFDGPDVLSNTRGMELWQLYKLITEKGGHYQAIDANATAIASWVHAEYPVIIAVAESSVHDTHLGGSPYTWDTSKFNHIITVTGVDHDHIFLCRDTVNQHSGSPYSYDGDKLSYLSATVFVPDWMPRPTSALAPTGGNMGVPANWKDDGTTLTAPNGVPIVHGFRLKVLEGWDAANWPLGVEFGTDRLEDSNQALGGGTQQLFRWSMLGYTKDRGVFEEWLGTELDFARKQVAKYYTAAQQLQQQLTALQAQQGQPQGNADALAAIKQVQAILAPFK